VVVVLSGQQVFATAHSNSVSTVVVAITYALVVGAITANVLVRFAKIAQRDDESRWYYLAYCFVGAMLAWAVVVLIGAAYLGDWLNKRENI
jgi:uncharacterized membrane protein YeaQ/YmgE (transglycosylase-associated protein family)